MTPWKIVETYLAAFYWEQKNFRGNRESSDGRLHFSRTDGQFRGSGAVHEIYLGNRSAKNRIEIRKIVAEGNDVAVFHDFSSLIPVIEPLPFSEWYSLDDGKMTSLRLYFDAREFAELIKDQNS